MSMGGGVVKPSLVIRWNREANQWSWTVQGNAPIVKLIGFLVNLHGYLIYRKAPHCSDMACVIEWDIEKGSFSYMVNDKLPMEELAGTLELVKQQLVDGQLAMIMAQQQMANPQLVLPPVPKIATN